MAQRMDVQYIRFYTQGSTAKRIVPAINAVTGTLPEIKKRKIQRVYVDPVAILGIVVALSMLIMMAVGIGQLRAEQQKTVAMEAYVSQLQQKNDDLQAEYIDQCDMEQIHRTALALGMIPSEQATHTSIEIAPPATEHTEQISLWQRIGTFLTGLFA